MTAQPHSPDSTISAGQGAPDATLRRYEFQVLGHLLGRKENVQGIALAVGLSLAQAQQVCQALCAQGKISVTTEGAEQIYKVASPPR
ncbi:hypothetical protein [Deinococcus peraridilitoris]|uniref:Sugar-specific transcriptional regulator TrmB n=1 Tax=Deinococcus peraridilitoris (strain DSM 19664 / LMG 22246 / CIP 109416 / KR-200) TaxID=937777 RepID=L0A416_DEIPD|nr:hypothetical protein [Deinococcus peraridilitoris]AFZ68164.1 hypothetical protein Deipe_2699 [Deinococcus peraridilitoris DSM 19664]